jgi:hypothetical protein
VPITYEIDPKQRLVTSYHTGIVTDEEIHAHRQKVRHDPEFNPNYRQLIDLSGITEVRVTTSAVTAAATDQFYTPGTRRAFVATTDATFGLARMFALRAEGEGQTIEVFRDRKKAIEWLGIQD